MKIAKMPAGLALVATAMITGTAATRAPDPLSVSLVVQDIIRPGTNCVFSANAPGRLVPFATGL